MPKPGGRSTRAGRRAGSRGGSACSRATGPSAKRYRDWLWSAYGLEARERARRDWAHKVGFAVSWCPGEPEVLDALAARLPPRHVLLHFPDWRTLPYDEGYPTFEASEKAQAFVAKARAMGFRLMPHFNAVDMDPSHPVYARVRDFQYRDVETKRAQGWGWYEDRVIGVPESNGTRVLHRDKKVMVKIHPGLGLWRSILGGAVQDAARALGLDAVFLDVTLVSQNLDDASSRATTRARACSGWWTTWPASAAAWWSGGEGRNEITAQGLSFAQAHLFRSWQENAKGVERTGGCAVGELLFGRLCRTIGYSGLAGRDEKEACAFALQGSSARYRRSPSTRWRRSGSPTPPCAACSRGRRAGASEAEDEPGR